MREGKKRVREGKTSTWEKRKAKGERGGKKEEEKKIRGEKQGKKKERNWNKVGIRKV